MMVVVGVLQASPRTRCILHANDMQDPTRIRLSVPRGDPKDVDKLAATPCVRGRSWTFS
jgi:hypothetical protein